MVILLLQCFYYFSSEQAYLEEKQTDEFVERFHNITNTSFT